MLYKSPELGLSEHDGSSTAVIIQKSHLGSIRHVADPDHTKPVVYFMITPTVLPDLPDLLIQSPFSWFFSITSADVMSHITCRSYEPYCSYNLSVIHRFNHQFTFYDCHCFRYILTCHVIDMPRWTHRILCDENSSMLIHVNASLLLDVLHGPGPCRCHGRKLGPAAMDVLPLPSGNHGEWLIMDING